MGLPSLLLAQVSLITLLVLTTERLLRSSATLTVRISNRLSPPKELPMANLALLGLSVAGPLLIKAPKKL